MHIDTNAHTHSPSSNAHLHAIDTGMLFHSKDNVCLFYCRFASLKYNWRTMHSYGRHKAKMNESLFHISQVFFR